MVEAMGNLVVPEPSRDPNLPAGEDFVDEGGVERRRLRTVQEIVQRAVAEVVRERVELIGASRTDSGVHARGQVAAFSCEPRSEETESAGDGESRGVGWPLARGADRLMTALNGRLPEDVLIVACEAVPHGFDPVADCVSKGYSYTIHASRTRALWDRRHVHEVWEPLDIAAMQAAAKRIEGEHDFAAFAAAGHGRLTTVRTVFSCTTERAGEERVRIDVTGNGFLWNMVRIIAGTLIEAGRGRLSPDDVSRAIESKDRRNAGPTMPAKGLCLEGVRYACSSEVVHGVSRLRQVHSCWRLSLPCTR